MPTVRLELWLWLGEAPPPPFQAVTPMRSVREVIVAPGTTVSRLLDTVARETPELRQHILAADRRGLPRQLCATLNDFVVPDADLDDSVVGDGDRLTIFRRYVGG